MGKGNQEGFPVAGEWEADIAVNPELATHLLTTQFPELGKDPAIALVGEGWDNWVYACDRWLFRFPRRHVGVPLIEREMVVLPHLVTRVPLPIPEPRWIGRPTDRYPYPFFGYQAVPGVPTSRHFLSGPRRSQSAASLAEFLKRLHRISAAEGAVVGAGDPTLARLDIRVRLPRFYQWLEAAQQRGLVSDMALFEREAKAIEECPVTLTDPCVVHGDLNFKNVLLDAKGLISGIIDWGDCHVGLPAIDFMFPIGFLPLHGQQIFREVYGPIDPNTWRLARFLAVYVNLIILVSAHGLGHTDDVTEARWELANIFSTPAVMD